MKDNFSIIPASFTGRAARGPAFAACCVLALAGCATQPVAGPAAGTPSGAPAPAVAGPAPAVPERALTGDLLYSLLLAEIAVHRNQFDVALREYMRMARETRDPRIAERAARIAVYRREGTLAREAAAIWVEAAPRDAEARQVLAAMLIRAGEVEAAFEHLVFLRDRAGGDSAARFQVIAGLLGREQDRQQALSVMARLTAGYQDDPGALLAHGRLALRAGALEQARGLFERALDVAPDNHDATVLYLRVLQRMGEVPAALGWLESVLDERPGDQRLQLLYARLLVDAKRFDQALKAFARLAKAAPDNPDAQYGLGLLYLQSGQAERARAPFQALIRLGKRVQSARFYLGQIEESLEHNDAAFEWYSAVEHGEHYLDAQIRAAVLLARADRLADARQQLHAIQVRAPSQQSRIARIEAELLSIAGRMDEAMAVYDAALEKLPDDKELLYARGMLAEKLNRLDILERDLRRIIELDPDNSQALNALGYTLADRTDRLTEALGYIERALALSPDDYFILDSMGWVLYRLGRYHEAVGYLRRALDIQPDAEIASHLGEVLWVLGEKDRAREVWNSALKIAPDDEKLLRVIKRLDR